MKRASQIKILRGNEDRTLSLLCQMKCRLSWGRGTVVEPSTAILCRTSLLTLFTLQLREAEEDEKETWMKNRPHSSLRIFISQNKEPRLHLTPFPKLSP